MKKDYRNKGFTLVEMIVVIVIIGILLGILVPGMFKYIQRAKEQQAIMDCRAVVTAAQTLALELYAKDIFNELEFQDNEFKKNICTEAGVSGVIVFGIKFSAIPTTEISYLEYKYSDDIIVVYDINYGSLYYIKNTNNLTDMDNRLKNYGKLFEEKYGNNYNNSNVWNDARKDYYNSDEAALTDSEKNLLGANTTLSESTLNSLKWKPCRYKNSNDIYEHYFVAASSQDTFYVSVAYYQGSYYYYLGNNGNTGSNSMPDANENTISKLINAKTNSDDLTGYKDIWVKIVK